MATDPHRSDRWILEADDVAAGYGGGLILDGVTAHIERGRITCIIGGSGCGKSTLLRTLVGLLTPLRGTVTMLGQRLDALDEEERAALYSRVGLMFQNGALLASLRIGENLSIPLLAHTALAPEVARALIEMKLGLVHLEAAIDKLPGELSGGMLKRAGLARALVLDPEVVLCDEPSAGLDPLTAADIDQLILKLKSVLGITVVVVTHELTSIKAIADDIIMLKQGKVYFHGTLEDALGSADPELSGFFGRKSAQLERPGVSLFDALTQP